MNILLGWCVRVCKRIGSICDIYKMPQDIQEFVRDGGHSKPFYIIFSGVDFKDDEGQAPVRLTQSLARYGSRCIYVYFHFKGFFHLYKYGRLDDKIFICSSFRFLWFYKQLFIYLFAQRIKTVLLITHPHVHVMRFLAFAKRTNIIIMYHVLDYWREFKKANMAHWFSVKIEREIIKHTALRFCVSRDLSVYYSQKYHKHFDILPNGYVRDSGQLNAVPVITKSRITLGYVGWLSAERLDWDLISETARKNPDWMFHMFGYLLDEGVVVPQNVKMHGSISRASYTFLVSQFDVCLIPYRKRILSAMSDPIKAYEYISCYRPIVVTGVNRISNNPYTYVANNTVESFSHAILRATRARIDKRRIDTFLKNKTWDHRAMTINHYVNKLSAKILN